MQDDAVHDGADRVDNVTKYGDANKTLIKPQINMRVLLIDRRERRKDANFVADDVLPDVRHL